MPSFLLYQSFSRAASCQHLIKRSSPWLALALMCSTLLTPTLLLADDSVSDANSLAARVDALQTELDALTTRTISKQEIGLPIHGYSNVDYLHASQDPASKSNGFALGNFDLYMLPDFGNNTHALVELNFEYGNEGALATDLERLEYGYTFSDRLTLWVGRFHTPYGFLNTAFHHGVQMMTATMRPMFLDFEDAGGILPAHSVGLQATGHWRTTLGKFGYDLYLANGDDIVDGTLDFNAYKDRNSSKLLGFNLHLALSGALEGLTVGVHGFHDVAGSYSDDILIDQTKVMMTGAYLVYENNVWQLMSEYYHFNDRNQAGGATHASSAWYAQAAYVLGTFTPFARIEQTRLDQQDQFFADQDSGRSYLRHAAGVRFDLNHAVALKAEWYRTHYASDVLPAWNGARAQFAVAF